MDTNQSLPLKRLLRGTELSDGLIFVNYRKDSRTATDGKVTVRLFKDDSIITRRWFQNAHINVA